LIYKFRDPKFTNKVVEFKRKDLEINLQKTIEDIMENLKNLPFINDIMIIDKDADTKRNKMIQRTLERLLYIDINFYGSNENKPLTYSMEIALPVVKKGTLEFLINGVHRYPLFQILDSFSKGKDVIRMIGSFVTIFFQLKKGWIGIADKFVHVGNLLCFYKGLDWYLDKCGYEIDQAEYKDTDTLGERLILKKKDGNFDTTFDLMIQNFLKQKVFTKAKFNTPEFWEDMCNSYRYKRFNLKQYFESIIEADVFIKKEMEYENIAEELFEKFLKNDFPDSRSDISVKNLLLSQYILNPFISEILSFLIVRRTLKTDKKRIINITDYLASKMPELHHLADHNVTMLHSISEVYKTTFSGPQGFDKKAMPVDLRNIDESFYGNIDPVYTPDREGCGIINWLTIDCGLIKEI